jgi:hypothetical protein
MIEIHLVNEIVEPNQILVNLNLILINLSQSLMRK